MRQFWILCLLNLVSLAQGALVEPLSLKTDGLCPRLTNIGSRQEDLYPEWGLPETVTVHPYNTDDIAFFPLAARYDPQEVVSLLPAPVQHALGDPTTLDALFLTVQDNPWNNSPVLLRPHAYRPFFPGTTSNIQAHVHALGDDGAPLLAPQMATVNVHDMVASPDNMMLSGITPGLPQAFYSLVTVNGRKIATRHVLLTVSGKDLFLDTLCQGEKGPFSLEFFAPLLGEKWNSFLGEQGIH